MAFCSNCGTQLQEGSKFCFSCGTKVVEETAKTVEESERKEFVGKVKKCPACGEEITSFTAICPSCGHEINESKISETLHRFINQINDCERNIAATQSSNKSGWASWSKTQRGWWVVLNVLFLCIPLIISLIIPLIFINATPKLTKEEKHMATLIENFPFPNDRESILEALIFAKEKIDFISKESINRKSAYWIRLWCSKAEQLKQKADMLFPNDAIVKQNYDEITADEIRVKKTLNIKAIIGVVILVAVIIFSSLRSGVIDTTDYNTTFDWPQSGMLMMLPEPETNYGRMVHEYDKQIQVEIYKVSPSEFDDYAKACREKGFDLEVTKTDGVFYAKNSENYDLNIFYDDAKKVMKISIDCYDVKDNTFDAGSYESTVVKNFSFDIPNYWEEEGSKNEYLQYYAEKGDKCVMLTIAYPAESDDNYDVSFDGLYADNENMIQAVAGMFTNGDVIDHEVFESDYGVKGILYRFSCNQKIDWNTKIDGSGYCFCFPSEKDRRWFFVNYIQTNNVSGSDYKDDYMKLIASIKAK